MSAGGFDPVIHAPIRLQACAILAAADRVEFGLLRDAIEISDSVLSKHLKQLEEAGFIRLHKAASDGRIRTWVSLTPGGHKAFSAHVAQLERLVRGTVAPAVVPGE